jgi:hypothetical protein
MVIRLVIETWVIGKGGPKRVGGSTGMWWVGDVVWGC